MEARALLAKDGWRRPWCPCPCRELFAAQPELIARPVLAPPRASPSRPSVGFGWERWPGERGAFVGMAGFGASAPRRSFISNFGITPAKVAAAARSW